MSTFRANASIYCKTRIKPVNGVQPSSVTLTWTNEEGTPTSVSPTSLGVDPKDAGAWFYEGYFVPPTPGLWTREWASGTLLGRDTRQIRVVP